MSQISSRVSKLTPIVWPFNQRDQSNGKRNVRLANTGTVSVLMAKDFLVSPSPFFDRDGAAPFVSGGTKAESSGGHG
jgi:hypothetical protein